MLSNHATALKNELNFEVQSRFVSRLGMKMDKIADRRPLESTLAISNKTDQIQEKLFKNIDKFTIDSFHIK